ncbi:restriction endonuclease subunit S [Actinomadura verrucosospora]
MSNWNTYSIEQIAAPEKSALATGPFGSAISSKNFQDSGVPVIRGSNLSLDVGVRLNENDMAYISTKKAAEFTRSEARLGDIIFTCWGTIGQLGIIDERAQYAKYIVSNKQMKLTPNRSLIDSLFLYYRLSAPDAMHAIQNNSIGSSVPGFNLTQLRRVKIDVPDLKTQVAIAKTLGALDDKIAVNDRVVRQTDRLRSLHLAKFLQERTRVSQVPLSSLADFVNGRAFTKNATGTGRMVIRIAELNSGPAKSTVYNDIEVPDKHIARPGDVLFAWSGSLCVARWFRNESIVNQHIFKIIPKTGIPSWLLYEAVQSKLVEFQRIAADKATTMGHIQRRHLDEPVNVPDATHIASLDEKLRPLWDRCLLAERESLDLAEMRDALLPKLMSGQVRIRDAEKVVEDAV